MTTSTNPLLPADQLEQWRVLNDTAADLGVGSVTELLIGNVRAAPGRAAVLAARRTLTYGDLAAAAGAVARRSEQAGGTFLICMEPGWEQVVAVAAALLAGVAFHAVDPGLGRPARCATAQEAGAAVVLTQSWLAERMEWPPGLRVLAVDGVPTAAGDEPLPEPAAGPDDLACLLRPDEPGGALRPMVHGALVDTVTDLAGRFDLGPDDRTLLITPLTDEVALTAVLLMLGAGGALVVPDDIDALTPAAWMTRMQRDEVTVWLSTPSLAALLVEHVSGRADGLPAGVRVALLGGEPLAGSLVARLRRSAGRPLAVGHLGVPGAPGLWAACLEVPDDTGAGHLPVGTPLCNRELHVLGEGGSLCPVWVSGRLHVGGRYVAADAAGRPLRPTDLIARLLPDGTVEVVGEESTRIAVLGHPLQLREIESRLLEHDDVLAAAAVPAGDGSVAYVRTVPGAVAGGAALLEHLRGRMSPYLLPVSVEPVSRFALTPEGRTDRHALAAIPVRGAAPAAGTVAPDEIGGELVERACALAARILDLSDVEPTMNLLDVGATSVQLVRIAVAAEDELEIVVDIEEVLRFPSVAVLVSSSTALPPAPAAPAPAGVAAPPDPELIRDPVRRLEFKDTRPGTRTDLGTDGLDVTGPPARRAALARRRTSTAFGPAPVPAARLGELLDVLCDLPPGAAEPRRAYPSAGAAYPVQTYVAVRRDRVDGSAAGTYYLNPELRRLVPVVRGREVPDSAHGWINREAAATAAFSLHLVVRSAAIEPLYGPRGRAYGVFEAGAMCQLLMTVAADVGLALCPVGEMDEAVVGSALLLQPGDEPVHTLLGGLPVPPGPGIDAAERSADMLRRIGTAAWDSVRESRA
jgi:SagB-type dehydrogenase family enzyme